MSTADRTFPEQLRRYAEGYGCKRDMKAADAMDAAADRIEELEAEKVEAVQAERQRILDAIKVRQDELIAAAQALRATGETDQAINGAILALEQAISIAVEDTP